MSDERDALTPKQSGEVSADTRLDDERTIIRPMSAAMQSGLDPDAPAAQFDDQTSGTIPQHLPGSSKGPIDERTIISPMQPLAQPPASAPPPGQIDPNQNGVDHTTGGPSAVETLVPPPEGAFALPLQKLEPGYVINNMYRVLQPLDQGGMGRVFRGEEIGTGEPVAIKVILPEFAEDTKAADMFRREARTLRLLHHDAIVRYFAYVPPDERLNLHALIMGFIEGTKLSDRIKSTGALSLNEIYRLFSRLADGLAAAHEIGVVHRDLSPDNVMLPDSKIGKAVLIDFGISRSNAIKDVTLGNEFAGKLKYVSPEQLGAFGGEADGRSDIYSMGLLIYAAATGGAAQMGSSIIEAVRMRESVPDLSALPVELQGLLYQMLQPDPDARLSSMTLVKQALSELQGDQGTSAGFVTTSRGTVTRGTGMGTMGTHPGQAQSAMTRSVEGLQAAPNMTNLSTAGTKPKAEQGATTLNTTDELATPKRKPMRRLGLLLLCAALLGVGGYIGMATLESNGSAETQQSEDLPERDEGPEAFLANAVAPGCTFATLRQHGVNATAIEGFHSSGVSLAGIDAAWAAHFDGQPELVTRLVETSQCGALSFAKAFQGRAAAQIELDVANGIVSRRDEIAGRLWGSAGRADWLAIVTPKGNVHALTPRLQEPIGEQRQFEFRIRSGAPGTYLLVAVSSEKALVRASAMQDGTEAAVIFDLIARELALDSSGAVDLGYVHITP